jgi:hypothetical protein
MIGQTPSCDVQVSIDLSKPKCCCWPASDLYKNQIFFDRKVRQANNIISNYNQARKILYDVTSME